MNIYTQKFTLSSHILEFDSAKGILRCMPLGSGKVAWVKQLDDISDIGTVSENRDIFFLSCTIDETSGKFTALSKTDGATSWFMPGREFLHVLHKDSLFLIFIDGEGVYYFLKIDAKDGSPAWQRAVESDLYEYIIDDDSVTLLYKSGRTEYIDRETGGTLPPRQASRIATRM